MTMEVIKKLNREECKDMTAKEVNYYLATQISHLCTVLTELERTIRGKR